MIKMKVILFVTAILFFTTACLTINADEWHRVNHNDSKSIYEHTVCKKTTNTSSWLDIFIPTKSSIEWQTFLQKKPSHITIEDCNAKKIFVTSAQYYGNQILTSKAANKICTDLGKIISGDSANYKALVYLGNESLITDTLHSNDYWNLSTTGATFIASGSNDFFNLNSDGSSYISAPILCDENGNCQGNRKVWTNFKPNGSGGSIYLYTSSAINTGVICPVCNWHNQEGCVTYKSGPCLEQQTGYTYYPATFDNPFLQPYWAIDSQESFYWYGNNSSKDIGWMFYGVYDSQEGFYNCAKLANSPSEAPQISASVCAANQSAALYCVEQ